MLVCQLCRLTLSDTEPTCPRDGHPGVPARSADVPAVVRARFAIVQPFAQGASGDLYVADDQQTGRRGLLKLLRLPSNITPAEKARLERELVKQATLGAFTLSVPLATGNANGVPWLFREWHEGVSLRVKLTRGGALAVPEALAVTAQIASALDELHRSGLLHRDVKPGHVLLNPQPSGLPRVTLIDAGIAARIDSGSVFDVMGTPGYLSPEQAKGKLVSFRSDLYALGCVLHEMLTGLPVFSGSPTDLLEAHANEPAPPPQVAVPTGVATLLAQLLAKDPRDRPFSAQQVRRALEPFLPEDASSRREATQAFEPALSGKSAKAVPPPTKSGSGTLRPPSQSAASATPRVPPPSGRAPRAGRPEELQAVDLETAEEVMASPPRRPRGGAQTLVGVPAQPATASAEATDELTSLDLEQAKRVLQPPSVAAARPTEPGLPTPVAAPAPATSSAPTAAATGSTAASSMRSAAPPWPPSTLVSGEDDGLDYDDLAETQAVDRDNIAWSEPAVTALGSAVAAAAEGGVADAESSAEVVGAAAEPVPARRSSRVLMISVASFALLGVCGLAAAGGAGVALYFSSGRAEPEVQSAPAATAAPETAAPEIAAPEIAATPEADPGALAMRAEPSPPLPVVPQPVAVPEPVAAPEPVALAERPTPAAAESAPTAEPEPAPVAQPTAEAPPEPAPSEPSRPSRPREERAEARAPERPTRTERAERAERPSRLPTSAAAAPADRSSRFDQVRQQALEHFRARRFAQAAQAYEQATDLNPRHAGSYAGLGASRLAQGQHAQAIRAYERAVALQPRQASYHAALGRALLESGNAARARQSFSRALSIDPTNPSARQGLQRVGG